MSLKTKAEKIFAVVCATISLFGLLAVGIAATTLQSWQSMGGGGVTVANMDADGSVNLTGSGAFNFSPTLGALNPTGTQTGLAAVLITSSANAIFNSNVATLTGGSLTAGTLSIYAPFNGANYKELIITTSGCTAPSNTLAFGLSKQFVVGAGTMTSVLTGTNSIGFAVGSGTTASSTSFGQFITGGTLTLNNNASSNGLLIMGGN